MCHYKNFQNVRFEFSQVLSHRKVIVEVTPMTFITAEMRAANVGRFMISCQIHAHRHGKKGPTLQTKAFITQKPIKKNEFHSLDKFDRLVILTDTVLHHPTQMVWKRRSRWRDALTRLFLRDPTNVTPSTARVMSTLTTTVTNTATISSTL